MFGEQKQESCEVIDFFTIQHDETTCMCDLCKLEFAMNQSRLNLVDHLIKHHKKELTPLYHVACSECGISDNQLYYQDFPESCQCEGFVSSFHDTTFYRNFA